VKRLIPGLLMTTLWGVLLLFGPVPLFGLAVTAIAAYGLLEFFRMTMPAQSFARQALAGGISLLPLLPVLGGRPEYLPAALFGGLLLLVLAGLAQPAPTEHGLHFLGLGSLGILYLGFCPAHLLLLRGLPQGGSWLLVLTAITAGGDTGAYYIGSTFGRHKLCPTISPKKTVEGAVGGITAGVLAAVATAWLLLPAESPWLIALIALLLSLVAIAGDLTESILKRCARVKDSGRLLAGHGGVLDRIDSLLLAGPALYYLLLFVSRLR
jgi:phosphatidate cytidylyltransferase